MQWEKYCCDIIVPILSNTNGLSECIDSIVKNTTNISYRLNIICNQDNYSEVEHIISNFDCSNILIKINQVSLCYIEIINNQLNKSNDDIVILDSSTIVGVNWISNIIECAYSQRNVAVTVPFTNNVCYNSPNILKYEEIPKGYDNNSFADLFQRISFRKYPQIYVGDTTCVFFRRDAFKEIGGLNSNYTDTYSSILDYLYRAHELGYICLAADDTFVFRKKNDTQNTKELKLKTLDKFIEEYPSIANLLKFNKNNIFSSIQNNLDMFLPYYTKDAENILFILHNDFEKPLNHPVGGTEFHVSDIISTNNQINPLVLISTGSTLILKRKCQNRWEENRFNLSFPILVNTFSHSEYKEILIKIVRSFNVNLIHIHHLIKHSFDSVYVAEEYKIPVFFTIHDFYLICPKTNLLDLNLKYCFDNRNDNKCKECIYYTFKLNSNFIKKWKHEVTEIIKRFTCIFAPSNSAKDLITKEYGITNIKVIEHGINYHCKIKKDNIKKEFFNIAFIGGLALNKGSDIIYNTIKRNNDNSIKWYLIGNIGDINLDSMEREDVIKVGDYRREDIVNILIKNDIDLICILSICPETFSYTLSEAWMAGIPVIGTYLGALKERIEKGSGGRVIKTLTPKGVLEEIYSIKNNHNIYKQLCENVDKTVIKNIEEMGLEYANEYYRYTVLNTEKVETKTIPDLNFLNLCEEIEETSNANTKKIDIIEYNRVKNELDLVYNSLTWRIQLKLRNSLPWLIPFIKKIFIIKR